MAATSRFAGWLAEFFSWNAAGLPCINHKPAAAQETDQSEAEFPGKPDREAGGRRYRREYWDSARERLLCNLEAAPPAYQQYVP